MQAGPSYTEAFLTVLRNVTKEDTVQYVLALLDQLLAGALSSLHISELTAWHAHTAYKVSAGTVRSKVWFNLTWVHMQAPASEQHV